ncbi:hypothetical protein [Longispora urticae]
MQSRPTKSPQKPDRAWTAVSVEPGLHEGEEIWHEDRLVLLAGGLYPPRFRLALTCQTTGVKVCVPLRIESGSIQVGEALAVTGVSSVIDHAQAIQAIARGPLATAVAMIAGTPGLLKIEPDGRWRWVPIRWAWGPPPPASSSEEAQRMAEARATDQYRREAARDAQRLAEVKRRMSSKWHTLDWPRLNEVAQAILEARAQGKSNREAIESLRTTKYRARSILYEDMRTAIEIGLIPPADGHVRHVLPWWNQRELDEQNGDL